MPAPKGNRFWEARAKHGRDLIFSDPQKLWDACVEYFEWVSDNPLHEDSIFAYQGTVTHEPKAKMRAMTLTGLCTFLDINVSTWYEYAKREGFSEISTRVEQIIRDQKFAGAAADLLNPSIIARDLGLADKSELTGKDGGPIETKGGASALDVARAIAFALARGAQEAPKED